MIYNTINIVKRKTILKIKYKNVQVVLKKILDPNSVIPIKTWDPTSIYTTCD